MKLGRLLLGTPVLLGVVVLGLVLPVAGWSAPLLEPPSPGDSTIVLPGDSYAGIHWRVDPPFPCEGEEVRLVFDACSCNVTFLPCDAVFPQPRLCARIDSTIVCVDCGPDTFVVPLGVFAAGSHVVVFDIEAEFVSADSLPERVVTAHQVNFSVRRDCVPMGPLPYVTSILIGEPSPCLECPPVACTGDSIPVRIDGVFPDNCIWLDSVTLEPSPILGPMPEPPVLRIRYAINSCIERACLDLPVPWHASVKLPPLPERQYFLIADASVVDQCTHAESLLATTSLPFSVADICTSQVRDCFVIGYQGRPPGGPESCDAFVSRERPAVVTVDIASGVALAALQGTFGLYPPDLRVTGMEAIGVASGMHLQWTATPEGARFVLFAESGAPIPDSDLQVRSPILRVTVAARDGVPIPEITHLYSVEFLGSDENAQAVPHCPIIATRMSLVLQGAVICREAPCDLNADAVADVRDLVIMVHCLLDPSRCTAPPDCNHDQTFNLDDVLCCARVILRGDAPPDTGAARPEPAVVLTVHDPRTTGGGADLPLTLAGAGKVGAARLELAYPAARYDVAAVEVVGNPTAWLELHETSADRLVIGLIGMGSGEEMEAPLDLVVHLALKSGQSAGGEVTLVGTQFSGPDGVALRVDAGQPIRPLGPAARLALSAGRPNPFSAETRFSVTLSQASKLDVAVYDLQGRRVETLYSGPAEAGSRDFVWQGRIEGRRAPSGVYFLRAHAAGMSATRKVLLLGRESGSR
jgi:hypothetical protein